MPIYMSYFTAAGKQGEFVCQNNLHAQMGQRGIQFGQLQTVSISWGDRRWGDGTTNLHPGAVNMGDGSVMKQLQGLVAQLRPYMAPTGRLGIAGLTANEALNFCRSAGIPLSMLDLNGDGCSLSGWTGPITMGGTTGWLLPPVRSILIGL